MGYTTFTTNPQPNRLRRRILFGGTSLVAVTVIIFFLAAHHATTTLRVVSTNPDLKHVATRAPFLKVTFNKQLSNKNISLSSNPSIVSSFSVHGTILAITLNAPDNSMDTAQQYTITIKNILATDGTPMKNETLSFVPQDTALTSLPRDQQQAILKQSATPPTASDINFVGVTDLFPDNLATLLETSQAVEASLFNFAPFANEISIDTSNANSSRSGDTTTETFSLHVDNMAYAAKITYDKEDLRLYIYDNHNKTLFDSRAVKLDQFSESEDLKND